MAIETAEQFTRRAAVVIPTDAASNARNADLPDLAQILKRQQEAKIDMVAPASALTFQGGNLNVQGLSPILTDTGVTIADGTYRPTTVADEGIASKLGIPLAYLRRMRAEKVDLYDANVMGWLAEDPSRKFLLRGFTGSQGGEGVLRAFLSDSYKMIDNFDVLLAALSGVKASGHDVRITGCDLTERRMIVRVESEHIKVLAPALLRGYRSPFTGQTGDELPIVSAGFVIANSEVGAGAFTITPRITVKVCENGMTIQKDALRAVHLGAKLDEGVIRWSGDTETKNLELITAQARDAVATFLDREYVETKLAQIEKEAGRPITDPVKTIEVVSKKLKFTDGLRESILTHFIQGGQTTAGGLMQAITATAQTLDDADAAFELEGQALTAMSLAASA
ncbi:DUF932 domain-containing protein [Streptomyces sp. NBRC 110465]|uniref:DUF932 domain-containing protein n=1 Tax=Streptomyces sp. NBRC 110465 TaxID=1897621 RepID=UPI000A8896F1|nr:DUF932 domain-containing protein [Streptomyces sp. NBRC 110465]